MRVCKVVTVTIIPCLLKQQGYGFHVIKKKIKSILQASTHLKNIKVSPFSLLRVYPMFIPPCSESPKRNSDANKKQATKGRVRAETVKSISLKVATRAQEPSGPQGWGSGFARG